MTSSRFIAKLWIPTTLLGLLLLGSLAYINHTPEVNYDGSYANSVTVALQSLAGKGPIADLAQDIVGFRTLIAGQSAYPMLAPAYRSMLGLHWNVRTNSTHPPSAFLLLFPVAFLAWSAALQAWSILTLGFVLLSLILLRLRWPFLIGGFLLMLIWPPVVLSLGQITAIWLLGFCIAYRFKDRAPFWSGIGAALAAATKLTPALLILPAVYRKSRAALLGFLLFVLLVLLILLALNPGVLREYVSANLHHSIFVLHRYDNGSLLAVMYSILGPTGVALSLLFLGLVLLACIPRLKADDDLMWMLAGYLSVAALPIAWCFSLLPLAPIMIYFVRSRQIGSMLAAGLVYVLPFIAPMGSELAARITAATIALIGLGFMPLTLAHNQEVVPAAERAESLPIG